MILSAEQSAIRDAVREYGQEQIKPRSAAFEAAGGFPAGLFEELAALGLMGMTAPEAVGGTAADYVSYALALIELAAVDGALSTVVSIQNSLIVSGLLKDGTEQQKARFLPDLVAGRMIGAFALTETDAGSDASALRTRAVKVEGGYRLTGAKQFITSGKIAGIAIVYAVTNPAAGKRGISGFIVPTDSKGYSVDKVEHKLGQAASDTCAIRFDELFVPEDLRLGGEGAGYGIALSNLEIAIDYARDRKSFGKLIIEHQAVGFRLADNAARLEAARHLVLHAAAMKDAGMPCLKEASMAKLVASETAEAVVSAAIQTLGGYGYLEEFGVAKIYRDVRVCQIYEGTSDIQRMVITRAL